MNNNLPTSLQHKFLFYDILVHLYQSTFVVESYQNGTEWYRLYKSGWVEQGGKTIGFNSSSLTSYSVTFLKEFADTNYNVTTLSLQRYNSSNPSYFDVSTRTTTGFSGSAIGAVVDGLDWEAKGMSAQS